MSKSESTRGLLFAMSPKRWDDQLGDWILIDQPNPTVRYVNAPADVVRRMSEREVWLFERGFAAYADGIPHDHVPAYENIDERRWWLKGWYAGRNANECINGNR